MIDPRQLLFYIIRPVLQEIGLWSESAERLILGTACQESECGRYLHQLGGGPALGIYQMEPATHADLRSGYLGRRPELLAKVNRYGCASAQDMIGNLYYATAMCRIKYLIDPQPIPDYLGGQAEYWKRVYNTESGAGTVQQYLNSWRRFIDAETLSGLM